MAKSEARLEVLRKIEEYEREGKFDQDVEIDPPGRVIMPGEVDYLKKKRSSKIKTKMAYKAARVFLNKILADKQLIIKDIIGVENFTNLTTGAIITCNHINAFDSFAIQMVYEKSKAKGTFYRVIREGNYTSFPGFFGDLMRNCYTLPLSSNPETMKEFITAVNTLLKQGDYVLVYPEQSMWWNYKKPKPLKKTAFSFAVKNDVPVLPCFICMTDSDVIDGDGFPVQEYTIYVGKPIYKDETKSNSENIKAAMDENYNCWKEIYESFYNTTLTYTCDEK